MTQPSFVTEELVQAGLPAVVAAAELGGHRVVLAVRSQEVVGGVVRVVGAAAVGVVGRAALGLIGCNNVGLVHTVELRGDVRGRV